jgi:hypothetical protein
MPPQVDDGFKALLAVEAALKAKKPRSVWGSVALRAGGKYLIIQPLIQPLIQLSI